MLEAQSEAELLQAENALYRQIIHPDESREESSRDERGRFTADPEPVVDYDGDLDRALAARGIDPAVLAEMSNKKFEQSWAEAAEQFKNLHPDWVGGESNKNLIGQIIVDNNLVDSPDKLQVLEAAYNHARENDLLVENQELTTLKKINEATSPAELRALLQPAERQARVQQGMQSGMWGK
jgi:hypothetical protein